MELGQELLRNAAKRCWRAQAGEYGNQGVTYRATPDGKLIAMDISTQLADQIDAVRKMLGASGVDTTITNSPTTVFLAWGNKHPEEGIIRVGGSASCPICGKTYYNHPMDQENKDYNGYPFLHIACDGTRVKL